MELLHFTGQVWRPPYEASSQLLQVTAGCTHNKCKFCSLYHGTKFRLSPITEVEEDLKVIQGVKEVEELGGMNFRVHFTGEDANPVMELMVNTSRQRGWNLKEIRLEKSSLDVIFAELSKK